jgi:VanZ family protein
MGEMNREPRRPLLNGGVWVLTAAWGGVIWKALMMPGEDTPDISFIPFADKFAHAAVFAVWGFLLCWALQRTFHSLSRLGVGVLSLLAVAIYGGISEVIQGTVGREADFVDFVADLLGGLGGRILYFSPKLDGLLKRSRPTRTIPGIQSSPRRPLFAEESSVETEGEPPTDRVTSA